MTLPINILQSLISRNRETITGLHELVEAWAWQRNLHTRTDVVHANFCHKQVAKYSKDIAKLVVV